MDEKKSDDSPEGAVLERYLIFTVKENRYALPSVLISEVAALEKVFPLPLVPPYVRGIINRYSMPYALIDLGFLFNIGKSSAAKVIILKEEVDRLAFLIDDITDFAELDAGQLIDAGQDETVASGSVRFCFEWKGCHVFCLDSKELINKIKQDFKQKEI